VLASVNWIGTVKGTARTGGRSAAAHLHTLSKSAVRRSGTSGRTVEQELRQTHAPPRAPADAHE